MEKVDYRTPDLSIVIPSLQSGAYIEKCLKSIIDQKNFSTEIIIIDGGSTDRTKEILKQYSDYISYWVSEPDRGQSHALNKGISIATGTYVGWMNADDVYLDGAFAGLARALREHPGFDIYYANKKVVDSSGDIKRRVRYVRPVQPYIKFYSAYRGITFCNQAAFFRHDIFKKVGMLDEDFHFGMDVDFFYRCIDANLQFYYCNEFWGAWRDHDAAKTGTSGETHPRRMHEKDTFAEKHGLYRGALWPLMSLLAGAWRQVLLSIGQAQG